MAGGRAPVGRSGRASGSGLAGFRCAGQAGQRLADVPEPAADWAAAVCDNCYADLHPGITVTVKYYSARWPADGRAVAAIRQRTRSDHDYPDIGHFPDIGQAITWQLWWQHPAAGR